MAQKSTSGNRIYRGGNSTKNEYPWQAYLDIKLDDGNRTYCGGSLISNQHILTAAHCTEDTSVAGIHVLLGEHDISETREFAVPISKITDHPDYSYDGHHLYNDLSILTLASPVVFSHSILPICLPGYAKKNYKGEVATVTGWGRTETNQGSDILQEVNVTVWSNNRCRRAYQEGPLKRNEGIQR